MICSNCKKPYMFLDKNSDKRSASCLKCGFGGNFELPIYLNYHNEKYLDKKYRRNIKTDPQMRIILDSLEIKKTDDVLDIGCGVGDYSNEISKKTKNITGVDRNVSIAKKRYSKIKFIKHDCNEILPFPDGSFDKLVSINLIEHLVDYEGFLSECYRILKPGGRIALVTANLEFFLHNLFYDSTHLYEWNMNDFGSMVSRYFSLELLEKSSAMFKYYPLNIITTKIIKPDILFIGKKDV